MAARTSSRMAVASALEAGDELLSGVDDHREVLKATRWMVFNVYAHNRDDHVKNSTCAAVNVRSR